MGKAHDRNHEQDVYTRVQKQIVTSLQTGDDPVSISSAIAEEHHVDQRTVFKWIQVITERRDRKRMKLAVIGTVLVWIGSLALAVEVLGRVFGWTFAAGASGGLIAATAAIGLIVGVVIVTNATRWAYSPESTDEL